MDPGFRIPHAGVTIIWHRTRCFKKPADPETCRPGHFKRFGSPHRNPLRIADARRPRHQPGACRPAIRRFANSSNIAIRREFIARPRSRTFEQPEYRFTCGNGCSTFAGTDPLRRSSASSDRDLSGGSRLPRFTATRRPTSASRFCTRVPTPSQPASPRPRSSRSCKGAGAAATPDTFASVVVSSATARSTAIPRTAAPTSTHRAGPPCSDHAHLQNSGAQ